MAATIGIIPAADALEPVRVMFVKGPQDPRPTTVIELHAAREFQRIKAELRTNFEK